MSYDLRTKLAEGERWERTLDAHFAPRYHIARVSRADQFRGIDRRFTCRKSGSVFTVEYKSDATAARTKNAFVETVSVDTTGAPGWVRKSEAQVLVYYVPPTGHIYIFFLPLLKLAFRLWEAQYPQKSIPNRGRSGDAYNTIGLVVPLVVFSRFCYAEELMEAA